MVGNPLRDPHAWTGANHVAPARLRSDPSPPPRPLKEAPPIGERGVARRGQSALGAWLWGAWPRVAMETSELWVGFVGAGRMAGGLVRGLLQAGTAGWGATGGSPTHGKGRGHGDSPGLAPPRRPCASCGAGKCGDTGTALVWTLHALASLLSGAGTWGQSRPGPFAKSQPVSGSLCSSAGTWGQPCLGLFPRSQPFPRFLSCTGGTWGQPFPAALPGHPALPGVPVPQISVGTRGQPCPASLPDIPVPQIMMAQPCPCSPCVPDCPCPIAQCGDSPAHLGPPPLSLHRDTSGCQCQPHQQDPSPAPFAPCPPVGSCWDWRNHIPVEIGVSGLCWGVPHTLGPPWPLTPFPVFPKGRSQPATSWPALPRTKTWMLGG